MKILITGSQGMVGRNLFEMYELGSLPQSWKLIGCSRSEVDLNDYSATVKYLRVIRPDMVVHAAAKVGGIQANLSSPVDFLVNNVDVSRNIILASKEVGIRALLNLGSSCMYPRNSPSPLSENEILKGELEPTNEGYALAKIYALKLCEYVHKENSELQYKTIIPCNIYGKYDKFDPSSSHLIPAIIHKIVSAMQLGQNEVQIWGDGQSRREFMYVKDFVHAIVFCIKNFDKIPTLMNIGLGFDYSINEYYELIKKICGFKGSFKHDLTKPSGMRQKMVCVKRISQLGWSPVFSLEKGIEETLDYYLTHFHPGKFIN